MSEAKDNLSLALALLDVTLTAAAEISALINRARSEGRAISDAEIAALQAANLAEREQESAAIAAAQAQGR